MKNQNLKSLRNAMKESRAGALFIVNHSSGKDSQAMTAYLRGIIPEEQLLVIHAELPGVEWEGTIDHIKKTIGSLPLIVTRAKKTFLEMVEKRGMWPSNQYRQCTSDLKRDPINKVIRAEMKKRGLTRLVNCMGIRAEESPARAKKEPWKLSVRNSKAGRTWFDWYPIFTLKEKEVFDLITNVGQKPHWAYAAGMSRLSCCFCILANKNDLAIAAKLNPKLFKKYVKLEKKIDHTFKNGKTLKQAAGFEV